MPDSSGSTCDVAPYSAGVRAVVITRPGGPEVLEVQDVPEPEPGPEPEPSPPPSRVDRWGIAGIGVGTGLVVLGGALLGSSHAVATGGAATQTETQYLARERRTAALSVSGIAMLSVGGAVLVAAGIRLGVVASRRRAEKGSPRVGVAVIRQTTTLS